MEPQNPNPGPPLNITPPSPPVSPQPIRPPMPPPVYPSVPIQPVNNSPVAPSPPLPEPSVPTPPAIPNNEPAPVAPSSGQVVSGGFDPSASVLPGAEPPVSALTADVATGGSQAPPAEPPGIVIGATEPLPSDYKPPSSPRRARFKKKPLLLIVLVIVVLMGSASAYYFGYYANASLIYSQALHNTGNGYDQLITYSDDQSKLNYKGTVGNGSYTLGVGDFATDGQLAFRSDGANSDTTMNINFGKGRFGLELRTIKSTTVTPAIYFKASGLSTLSSLIGASGAQFNSLDNQWIAVDPSLLNSLKQGNSKLSQPTHDQVLDELRAFGKVNDEYVFTTDKSKAITTVVKKFGIENVGGHKTYHYRVALNKANVKQYITAQRNALRASKLNAWIQQNNYENYVDLIYDSMEQTAGNITPSDTFDVWADMHTRIIYKVRFSDAANPSDDYVDLGLDYKGGSDYPFFVDIYSKSGGNVDSGSFVTDLNTQTHATTLKLNFKGTGADTSNLNGSFVIKPTNSIAPISVPTGAQPLSQVLNNLGLGSLLTQAQSYTASPSSTTPSLTFQD